MAIVAISSARRWPPGALHGFSRTTPMNEGARDINVFIHEEAGFQFVNAQDALVPPVDGGYRVAARSDRHFDHFRHWHIGAG